MLSDCAREPREALYFHRYSVAGLKAVRRFQISLSIPPVPLDRSSREAAVRLLLMDRECFPLGIPREWPLQVNNLTYLQQVKGIDTSSPKPKKSPILVHSSLKGYLNRDVVAGRQLAAEVCPREPSPPWPLGSTGLCPKPMPQDGNILPVELAVRIAPYTQANGREMPRGRSTEKRMLIGFFFAWT